MRSDAVLIIGDEPQGELLEALFAVGLTAVARPEAVDTLPRIRQRSYEVLIIDDSDPERDVLELVLNIRDYDEDVPIVVLGNRRPAVRDEVLPRLGVRWLSREHEPHEIARQVLEAMDVTACRRGSVGP
jgi:hypothetical protein